MNERARVRFEQSPTRCPYCHDDCSDDVEVVACRGCVAKHHAECWEENGRCGSCGDGRALREGGPAPRAPLADGLSRAAVKTANELGAAVERTVLAAEPVVVRLGLGALFAVASFGFGLVSILALLAGLFGLANGQPAAFAIAATVAATLAGVSWLSYRRARARLTFRERPPAETHGKEPLPKEKA